MIGRLLLGLLKGILVGGLFGFGIANIPGLAAPGAVAHYLLAAAAGVLVGLVAGKPIWAKDAKIEAGMKEVEARIEADMDPFVAARQMDELAYYNTFFQTTHVPAIALAAGVKDYEVCPAGVVEAELRAGRAAGAHLLHHGGRAIHRL